MIVLAHRGFWKEKQEQNTLAAFSRAFQLGYGVETDVRDQDGEIVIAHDPATGKNLSARDFFKLHQQECPEAWLAINLKSSELQKPLGSLLREYKVMNYFLFDGAVPDSLKYLREQYPVFTRHSELEAHPAFYDQATGVWLDELTRPWIAKSDIEAHLRNRKRVCLVSPELHARPALPSWQLCKELDTGPASDTLMICTDEPTKLPHVFFDYWISREAWPEHEKALAALGLRESSSIDIPYELSAQFLEKWGDARPAQ